MSAISIKQLLEAGVHFGHQTHRWNPKMQEYIFGERNGIYIIDLQQTLKRFKEAVEFVSHLAASGKNVLFVGTKRQAQEVIEEEAQRCGMHFVTNRWLGGLLTNFATIQKSIKRYKDLDRMSSEGFYDKISKKEAAQLERERKKLDKNLRGIREMDRLPGAVFVIDTDREEIAVREANRLDIPVVAVVDTNCDPDLVDYVIPGNDDALRAVKLFAATIADAVLAGRAVYEAKVEEENRIAREKAAQEAAARRAEAKAREEARAAAEAAKAKAKEEAEAKAKETAKAKAESEATESAKSSEGESKTQAEAKESAASEPKGSSKAKEEKSTEAKPPSADSTSETGPESGAEDQAEASKSQSKAAAKKAPPKPAEPEAVEEEPKEV